jgi:predicted  nucleic acid-binding Zn-ribbon protein
MYLEKQLSQLNGRLSKARDDLHIIEEQLLFQMDVFEQAKTRMLVSETPLSERDHREARDDLQRLMRQREKALVDIAELQTEQDRLLDSMLRSRA